jgi:MscS family membrane protein
LLMRLQAFFLGALLILCPVVTWAQSDEAGPDPDPVLVVETGFEWLQERIPEGMRSTILFMEQWQWLLLAVIAIAAWLIQKISSHIGASILNSILAKVGQSEKTTTVISSVGKSLGWFASALTVDLLAPALQFSQMGVSVMDVVVRALATIGGLLLAYRLVDLLGARMEEAASLSDSKLDDQLAPMIRKSLKFLVTIGAVIYLIQSTGEDVMPLVTGLGVLGIGVSLAAKDTFANLFGSITVFTDRPFQLGDWVKVGGIQGVVEEIGFRCTRIRTFESSLVSVPNSELVNGVIDNMGQRNYRRFKTMVGLRYETPADKIEAFCEGVKAIAAAQDKIETETVRAALVDFGASSLDVLVNVRMRVADYSEELEVKQSFLLELIRLAEELEVGFAFPSTSLYVESTPEHPFPAENVPAGDQLRQQVEKFGPGGELSRTRGSGNFNS